MPGTRKAAFTLMSTATTSFYVTGGTLRQDAPSYVERQADKDLYQGLTREEFCYVLTSRQMGKSSLMVRTAARLRDEGVAVAVLDLTAIGQTLTPEQWYDGLLARLGQQLNLEDDLDDFWLEHEKLGPLQRWMTSLRQVVLRQRDGRVVIFLDEIDAVRNLPFSTDEFFAGIRECYNRRSEDPEFQRLTFCLLGVATPSDLIQDTRTTPFNIGHRIELTDFSAAEASPLAGGLGRDGQTGAALLERVLYWTGGHPYLTQRLCQAVAQDPNPKSKIQNPKSEVDRQCEALYLSRPAQEKDDNLLFVRERLLRSEAERASLLDLYAKVRRGERIPPDDTNQLVSLLRLSGITRVETGLLRVRNRIYERVFDQAWVTTHMPDAELRRQQAAYRHGLLRASAAATVIVVIMAGLALVAVTQARHADQQRRRALEGQRALRRHLYAAQMNIAYQAWEIGNVGGALQLLEAQRPQPGQEDLRGFAWRYLWQRCQGDQLLTLHGHLYASFDGCVAFSPDGRTLASGGDDGNSVRLWDAASGRPLATLRGHRAGVAALAFSPDGKTLAAGDYAGMVKLWDLGRRQVVAAIKAQGVGLSFVAFSPDGRTLAWVGQATVLEMWDVPARRRLTLRPEMRTGISTAAFSPDSKILATGNADNSVKLWDLASQRRVGVLKGHTPRSIAFSPDGKRLATTGWDSTIRLWDLATRLQIGQFRGHRGPAWSVVFSRDGKYLATAGDDSTVRLWDAATRQQLALYRGHQFGLDSVAFSPDGRRLASGGGDGTVRVWDATTRGETPPLRGYKGQAWWLTFSPDGKLLASANEDQTVKLWDVAMEREVASLKPGKGHAGGPAFSPDGKTLATDNGPQANLWDVATRRMMGTLTAKSHVGRVLFSPDGRTLASKARFAAIRLWDVATRRQIAMLPGPTNNIWASAFSPDGRTLASADFAVVKLFDVASRREIASLPGHGSDEVMDLAFSPDGKILASAGYDQTVRLWDPAARQPLGTLEGYAGVVFGITFSPDGRTLAAACADSTITLWDVATQQKVATLKGHTGNVNSVAFSPDGNTLASVSVDKTMRLWRAPPFPETDPVRFISVSGSDRAVTLQWQPLPWALGYNVYRRSGAQAFGRSGLRGRQRTSTSASRSRTPERLNAWTRLTARPLMETSFTDRSPALVNSQTETYAVAALFRGAAGRVSEGPRVTLRATPVAVPPCWMGSSINEADRAGSVVCEPARGGITLAGSGRDIGGEADGCYFLNQAVTGDFQATVQALTWPTAAGEGVKAGLMVRESLEAGARDALLAATPDHTLVSPWRLIPHGSATWADPVAIAPALKLPLLLRLTRQGNTIIREYSRNDGRGFQPAGPSVSFAPALPETVYVGLAITAHDEDEISKAKFSGLAIRKQ